MSNVERLSGEVYLPEAALATVKRLWRNHYNGIINEAYDFLKRFRTLHTTTNAAAWQVAIEGAQKDPANATPARQVALAVAAKLSRPRAVKWDDFELSEWGKAGVSSSFFPFFNRQGLPAGGVTFTGRTMSWTVTQGEGAVEAFWDGVSADFLTQVLSEVEWLRGSGGGESYHSTRFFTEEMSQVEYLQRRARGEKDFPAMNGCVLRTFGPLGRDCSL